MLDAWPVGQGGGTTDSRCLLGSRVDVKGGSEPEGLEIDTGVR